VEGEDAFVTFSREGDQIAFLHTLVPPAIEGRGIAGQLARHGLEYARENGLRVLPRCPYIRTYIDRHPEYQDLVG
jgi:predicted GNAT family acetyltransferase